MAVVGMVHVGAELLRCKLPVALQDPSMHPADDFGTGRGPVEIAIEVPSHVAEIIGKTRRGFIPGAEDEAMSTLDTRHLQRSPLTFVELVAIAILFMRNRNQPPAEVVSPSVIRAGERARVAAIGAADAHSAMT